MFISANCGIRADSRIAWRSCPLAMVSLCPSQWIHFWLQSGISRAWIRTTFASTVLPSCYSWLFSKFCHQRVATCNQGSVHTWHLSRRRRGRKRSLSRLIIHIQIDFSIAWSQPGFSILSFGSGSTFKEEKVSWVQTRIKVNHIRIRCSSSRLCPQVQLSIRSGYCSSISVFHLKPGPHVDWTLISRRRTLNQHWTGTESKAHGSAKKWRIAFKRLPLGFVSRKRVEFKTQFSLNPIRTWSTHV